MARLTGKIAFITGAGTGIGRATATLFAREGAQNGVRRRARSTRAGRCGAACAANSHPSS
jgi:NAD(P)-dependent dehydrogenase (short-subunit alcohol dehydrogenase family)